MSPQQDKLSKSFFWLNVTQFLGALNDNVFQLLLVFFLIGIHGEDKTGDITSRSAIVFVVPFLLFTAVAGKLADRFSKRDITVAVKIAEVVIMILGCLVFLWGGALAIYLVLFLMCSQSAFFGPSKYGIVPELVEETQLSRANSFLEGFTYLAIVVGAAVAPFLSYATGRRFALAGIFCVLIAAGGLWTSVRIGRTRVIGTKERPSVFFISDIVRTLLAVRKDRDLILAIFASAFFMLLGGFLKINVLPFGMDEEVLGWSREKSGYLFVVAAVGIGVGSYLAGRVSGRHIEFGIIPLGALGLALTGIGLAFSAGNLSAIIILVFLLGVSAGLYIVPVHAFIQLRAPDAMRGQVVAASGFLGWVGILLSAILFQICNVMLGISPANMFLIMGLVTLVLAITAILFLPDFFLRFMIISFVRLVYRIRAVGLEHIPIQGGALLVSNHVSWVDAFLLGATQQRRVRFIMDRDIFGHSRFRWLLQLMRTIEISQSDPPKQLLRSLRKAREALDEGYLVCIFAEGSITRTGTLRDFKAGFQRILKGGDYPIIPAYIGGAWGSFFSWYSGRLMSTLPRKFPYPIGIHFGRPLGPETSPFEIRQKVIELSCDYYDSLKQKNESLGERFIRTARKHWSDKCISDVTGKSLTYGRTLTATVALANYMRTLCPDDENVGILLPPSVGGTLVNLAVALLHKTSVNLSYAASAEARRSAIDQCGIRQIISSRQFLEKAALDDAMPGLVFIEDILDAIDSRAKRKAWLKARFLPARWLAHCRSFNPDDVATIIFSSGSTGIPKGVMLTHHNILSNVKCALEVFRVFPQDNLVGMLPFFHSFGYTVGIWLGLTTGASVSYVPNPLDGKAIAQSIVENRSTLLIAAPTFLLTYIRRAEREDFATLRMVITGAEKLKKRLADAFEERFGIRPLEGYGTTELSPIVSLNLPDVELGGVTQIGTKEGTVGHPIPGVAARIVDPETGQDLGPNAPGLLLIKGSNVMKGYLNDPEKTARAIKDGWYNTGDVAAIDEDGFITITDRLSRFSKIGGEMVPHLALEEICHSTVRSSSELAVAVTSLPHPTKGEELVVLYVPELADPDTMHKAVVAANLPNLCKPRRDNYLPVEKIPILGSGKLDLMRLKQLAVQAREQSMVELDE